MAENKTDVIMKMFIESPDRKFRPEEIEIETGFYYTTISGTLNRLLKQKKIFRPERGYYQLNAQDERYEKPRSLSEKSDDPTQISIMSKFEIKLPEEQEKINKHIKSLIYNIRNENNINRRADNLYSLKWISARYQVSTNPDIINLINDHKIFRDQKFYEQLVEILDSIVSYEKGIAEGGPILEHLLSFIEQTKVAFQEMIFSKDVHSWEKNKLWEIYFDLGEPDDVINVLSNLIKDMECDWRRIEETMEKFLFRISNIDERYKEKLVARLMVLYEETDDTVVYRVRKIMDKIREHYYLEFMDIIAKKYNAK